MSAPVDVLAVLARVVRARYSEYYIAVSNRQRKGEPYEIAQASAAIAGLMEFNRSLVLNGRQRFNATPEQIALSDAAETALRACGGGQ